MPPYLSEARVPNYFRKEHFKGIMSWGLVRRRDQLIKKGEKIREFKYQIPQQEHETEGTISQRDTADQVKQPGIWNVPHPRNPLFTGRDDILNRLHQQLFTEKHNEMTTSKAALTQPKAIRGLGGIGKTQIAIEYAYRYSALYAYIFWINAATETMLISSFIDIAKRLPSFPAKYEMDQQELVAAVKRWFEECEQRWLLIFDNIEADDFSLMQKYFPQKGDSSILFTTRANSVRLLGASSIEVEKMDLVEGTKMLLRHVERFDLAFQTLDEVRSETTRVVIDEATATIIDEATNLVIILDHFPLALDQAGAYIEKTGCSLVDYIQIYQAQRKKLLAQREKSVVNDYPDSVATTWSLSFDKVARANPAAAELLHLCAFLAPDKIPDELIINGADQWSAPLRQSAADLFTFNNMMEELLKYSLVKRLSDDKAFSIHCLVQAVQRDGIEPEVQHQWAERVVRAVNQVFPDQSGDIANWPQCLRFLEQVKECHILIEQYMLSFTEAADLLNRTGIYLNHYALYAIAEPLCQRAVTIWEQALGTTHPDTAVGLNNLAALYHNKGELEKAEPLYQRALVIREQTFGTTHPLTATSLNNLAELYRAQGKYTEAEPLYQRILSIREQQLGAEHPSTAASLNNLAMLYEAQSKYEQAEPLYQRVLSICEQQLGAEHPDTATSLNNLAMLYQDQGRYEQAEPLYQRALHIYEQQLGLDHPQTQIVHENYSLLLQIMRYDEEV